MNDSAGTSGRVRLDKWLWAARFFKTRGLAKAAIEGGKVHIDGARCKVSREVGPGMTLQIRQGWDELEVVVQGVSEQRGPAPQARLLYSETEQSVARREKASAERRALAASQPASPERPTKKQRRQIHGFREAMRDIHSSD